MKKIIFTFLIAAATTITAFSERQPLPMEIHQTGEPDLNTERDRNPINLPISIYYDSDTGILEVWCQDDNIQGEVFVYDASGAEEAYSPCMNVTLQLSSDGSHSLIIKGDGWEGEAFINSNK